jgi:hypothetical protein
MRAKWPTVRWMQGREIDGDGVTFGPTVQKLKTPITARKPNDPAHRQPPGTAGERKGTNE